MPKPKEKCEECGNETARIKERKGRRLCIRCITIAEAKEKDTSSVNRRYKFTNLN